MAINDGWREGATKAIANDRQITSNNKMQNQSPGTGPRTGPGKRVSAGPSDDYREVTCRTEVVTATRLETRGLLPEEADTQTDAATPGRAFRPGDSTCPRMT